MTRRCLWCREAFENPHGGRIYCARPKPCRQRAYEARHGITPGRKRDK